MDKNNRLYEVIQLFDTSVGTANMGDYIIMQAVRKQLYELFPEKFFVSSATHDRIGKNSYKVNKRAKLAFVGGTNIMGPKYSIVHGKQWAMTMRDSLFIKNIIGIGIGWQDYTEYDSLLYRPQIKIQKLLFNRIMSHGFKHSVRDSFTQKKMAEYGMESINTACVTMWGLTNEHLRQIPKDKANSVVFTITNYRNTENYRDMYKEMIEKLLLNYQHVYMWVQSSDDVLLLNSLNIKNSKYVRLINPNLKDYDNLLDSDIDYVGTRLHAGIRALQHKKRTLIIGVDNRANEIAKDTNLPVIDYTDIANLESWILKKQSMDIIVPFEKINEWKSQFKV